MERGVIKVADVVTERRNTRINNGGSNEKNGGMNTYPFVVKKPQYTEKGCNQHKSHPVVVVDRGVHTEVVNIYKGTVFEVDVEAQILTGILYCEINVNILPVGIDVKGIRCNNGSVCCEKMNGIYAVTVKIPLEAVIAGRQSEI